MSAAGKMRAIFVRKLLLVGAALALGVSTASVGASAGAQTLPGIQTGAQSSSALVPAPDHALAFQSSRGKPSFCCRIHTMDADGSDVQPLLKGFVDSYDPAWSPDGMELAFASVMRGNFEIYRVPFDESRAQLPSEVLRLTRDRARDTSPAWSPEGEALAFITTRDGNYELYKMRADGTLPTNLTNNEANNCGCFSPFFVFAQPAYSPDGETIVFTSDLADPGENLDVYVIGSDGEGLQRLTNDGSVDAEADWSPDGQEITFMSERDGDAEIYVMAADGADDSLRQLTNNAAIDTQPDWSPEGERIAFTSFRDGNAEIYVMGRDGTAQTNLTNDPALDERADWRPIAP